MSSKTKSVKPAAKPALHIQAGGVRIPIWKNEGKSGREYFKAGEPKLAYKDKKGQWCESKSYGAHDLINLIKAAAIAHTEVVRRNRKILPPANDPAEDEDDA
jgi:hypothetical protein